MKIYTKNLMPLGKIRYKVVTHSMECRGKVSHHFCCMLTVGEYRGISKVINKSYTRTQTILALKQHSRVAPTQKIGDLSQETEDALKYEELIFVWHDNL